jgi:hypothetical protein
MEDTDIEYVDLYLHGTSIDENILTQSLELYFQEIELAIQIGKNEVWGVSSSIDLKRYLFNHYVTLTQIKNEISTYLSLYCEHYKYFPTSITAETIKNSNGSDLIYIVVTVSATDENGVKQDYKQKFLIGS